ncbi:MAG TPA: hypothetical protein VKC54_02305 [Patescibacteria group bacterium]|nr:hypothetical protein [Patescibacteria group bacterium]
MKIWSWLVVILIVAGVGYFYKDQIQSAFMGAYGTPSSNYGSNSQPVSPSGEILTWVSNYAVGSNGMTLYVFDKDTKGVSNCNGSCAGLWPPYTTSSTPTLPTNVTLIKRADGSMQFAYKGMPLYYYAGDKNAGDTTGDGVQGTWHLVKP